MKKILLIIPMLITSQVFGQYSWNQKASMSFGRYAATGFSVGNKGYVCSGYNQSNQTLSDLWEWDQVTNSWSQKASLPSPRFSAASFVIGNYAYVGLGLSSGQFKNDLNRYDPVTNSWSTMASLPDAGRYGSGSFSIDGMGYVVNGNMGSANGPYSAQLWQYDPDLDAWNAKSFMPGTTRYGTRGFELDGMGYTVCGVHFASSTFLKDLWMYNPNTDSWTQKTNFPGDARDYPVTFKLDDGAVVGSGNSFSGQFTDFYIYHSATNAWTPLPSLPSTPRWAAVGFSIGSRGYLASGMLNTNVVTPQLWELVNPVGLNEPDAEISKAGIYPCPARDYVFVESNSSELSNLTFAIFSLKGSEIISGVFNNKSRIDISELSAGTYLLNIYNSGIIVSTGKFLRY